MPPHSPSVRQLLAAQFAEDRRLQASPARRATRRRPLLPRPLAALRARRAAAAPTAPCVAC